MYNRFVNLPLLQGAYNITFSLIDKGLLEVTGPTGASKTTYSLGRLLTSTQTGRAYDYAFSMLLGAFLLLIVGFNMITTEISGNPAAAVPLADELSLYLFINAIVFIGAGTIISGAGYVVANKGLQTA